MRTHCRRFLLVALVILTILLFHAHLLGQSAQTCGTCHQANYGEWKSSPHAAAWKSTTAQAQATAFGNPGFCAQCHTAETVWKQTVTYGAADSGNLQPGPASALVARAEAQDEGVTCISCHLVSMVRKEGKGSAYVGSLETNVAGHDVVRVADFREYKICGVCHGRPAVEYLPSGATASSPFHHSGAREFAFNFGKSDCAKCHMPHRPETLVQLKAFKDLPVRERGTHTFTAKRYEQLASALQFALAKLEGRDVLEVTNKSIGHPLRISAGTEYRVVLSRLEGTKVAQTASIEITEADTLAPGVVLRLPLPSVGFRTPMRIDFYVKEGAAPEQKVFTKQM